ncbi:transposase [Leekyejoonella antrihumi]|uniref:transposase n=1 Tax=Leekyejoonella antrihumi TaxID=1660198 RepID=UPI0024824604|nr:transposase [Leekyejoonella antrihumi]
MWDEDEQRLISDAEVAEIEYTAFTSLRKDQQVTARLIVRRVKRLNPASVPEGQSEMFAAYRYHAVLTNSPMTMLEAEADHRAHAIVEQSHADMRSGPLAHLPSGQFAANGAWLVLAAITHNLMRAAGTLASMFHARATTGTIRAQLIEIPARLAHRARRLHLHLPTDWPWQTEWENLFAAACGPPGHHTT